jgi:hypothetical protein
MAGSPRDGACPRRPYHPQTEGKIERWHQTLKNRILLEHYYLPGDLERRWCQRNSGGAPGHARLVAMSNPFRYFNSSPEVIRLAVMMYVRYPLSLRNVEDLLAERGIDISYETVRFWWNRFGPMFAAEIRKRRVAHMRGDPQWR